MNNTNQSTMSQINIDKEDITNYLNDKLTAYGNAIRNRGNDDPLTVARDMIGNIDREISEGALTKEVKEVKEGIDVPAENELIKTLLVEDEPLENVPVENVPVNAEQIPLIFDDSVVDLFQGIIKGLFGNNHTMNTIGDKMLESLKGKDLNHALTPDGVTEMAKSCEGVFDKLKEDPKYDLQSDYNNGIGKFIN